MSDEQWAPQVEMDGERTNEIDPSPQRVRTSPLRIAEGRQVDRKNAVRPSKPLADRPPHEARLDKAAEQDDRAAVTAPAAIGDELPVDTDERAWVKGCRGLDPISRCDVVDDRRQREHDEQLEQNQAELLGP